MQVKKTAFGSGLSRTFWNSLTMCALVVWRYLMIPRNIRSMFSFVMKCYLKKGKTLLWAVNGFAIKPNMWSFKVTLVRTFIIVTVNISSRKHWQTIMFLIVRQFFDIKHHNLWIDVMNINSSHLRRIHRWHDRRFTLKFCTLFSLVTNLHCSVLKSYPTSLIPITFQENMSELCEPVVVFTPLKHWQSHAPLELTTTLNDFKNWKTLRKIFSRHFIIIIWRLVFKNYVSCHYWYEPRESPQHRHR